MRNLMFGVVFLLLVAVSATARAQTPSCDALGADKKAVASSVLESQHPYVCCDDTIAGCLKKKRVCSVAVRLANQVCRMAAAGKGKADIERAIARRATSMMPRPPVPIDLGHSEVAGDPNAKVTLTAYLCARCPYCARLTPQLYKAVTDGTLKGKVKMYVRPFPIRSHPNSTEGGLAMVSAEKLGKFWPFLLHLYNIFDKFDPNKLPDCAASYGMNREEFVKLMADPAMRARLVQSKKEGVRNKVSATPTLFINGRMYSGELDADTVIDVLEEEHDRLSGKNHR